MGSDVCTCNFSFAFENPKFSDRVLSIEIIPDPAQTQPTGDGTRMHSKEHAVNSRIADVGDRDKATRRHDPARSPDISAVLYAASKISSLLFSNGRGTTLQIHASEEAALSELLKFMYTNTLSAATHSSLDRLVDILLVADKFEVASSAYRLVKQFIAVEFSDIDKFENQVLNLPLAGIEALLSGDAIQVPSEDFLYDLVLKWSELHYPQLEERREVWETHLRHLIRFPYMTSLKLKEVATGTNFSPEVASEIVLEALFFQTGTQYRQRQLASGRQVASNTTLNTYHRRFVERAYILRPLKSIKLELPHLHCVAYLDLKHKECKHLFPSGKVCSQAFQLDKQWLFLSASCNMDGQNVSHCFGLHLGMKKNGSSSLVVVYEFAAWSEEEGEYKTVVTGRNILTGEKLVGCSNPFNTPWSTFIARNSPYFIDGKILIRAVVTVSSDSSSEYYPASTFPGSEYM